MHSQFTYLGCAPKSCMPSPHLPQSHSAAMHMPPLHGANPKHFGAPEIPNNNIDMLSDGESTGSFDTKKTTPISGDVTSDTEENPLNLEESDSEDQYFGGEDEAEEVSEVDLEIYNEDSQAQVYNYVSASQCCHNLSFNNLFH